jgi:hypothetical protein
MPARMRPMPQTSVLRIERSAAAILVEPSTLWLILHGGAACGGEPHELRGGVLEDMARAATTVPMDPRVPDAGDE